MPFQIILLAVITALLGYIIYLHIQLAKKNIFIESTLKKFSGSRNGWSSDEIIKLMKGFKEINLNKPLFGDRLFDDKPLNFLLENYKDIKIFIHYTRFEEDARNILKEGFMFSDSFYKTALPVSDDRLDLLIKHNGKKSFGDYLVIISFSNTLFEHYASEIDKRGLKEISVENVLTEIPPFRNENADVVYKLSNKFIKGYINHQTGEIFPNPEYNPKYNTELFEDNVDLLQHKK